MKTSARSGTKNRTHAKAKEDKAERTAEQKLKEETGNPSQNPTQDAAKAQKKTGKTSGKPEARKTGQNGTGKAGKTGKTVNPPPEEKPDRKATKTGKESKPKEKAPAGDTPEEKTPEEKKPEGKEPAEQTSGGKAPEGKESGKKSSAKKPTARKPAGEPGKKPDSAPAEAEGDENVKPKDSGKPQKEKTGRIGRKGIVNEWLTNEGLTALAGFARRGLTNKQIAEDAIGISQGRLYEWIKRYPEIDEALKRGKINPDVQVENALYLSALGQTVKVKKPMKIKKRILRNDRTVSEEEEIVIVEEEQYIKPDVTAQIFWLKNRLPDRWRNTEKLDADRFEHQKAMDKEKMEILRSKAGVVNAEDETEANDIMMGYAELFTDPVSDRTITDIVQAIDDNSTASAPASQADGKKDQ